MSGTLGKADNPSALTWEEWDDLGTSPEKLPFQGPHQAHQFAQRLFADEALQPPPISTTSIEPEPYSLQWFLNLENHRHSRQGRWIPKLLEFTKHAGDNLLALGNGLGTDWVQYAQHGARVVVCGASNSQLDLIRRNFQLRGLTGRFLAADPKRLPIESASMDVACMTPLPSGENTAAVVEEVYRVLKPGGKVLAVAPARFHVDFWFRTIFFWHRWFFFQTKGPAIPGKKYSGWGLRRLFGRFTEHRIRKRQLHRAEAPWMWRFLPLPLLARLMGRFLILKAFKPLK
jgi:ubiquinone/menaquinone biosynthesis C-methylase UbiE